MKIRNNLIFSSLIIWLVSFFIFLFFLKEGVDTDIQHHAKLIYNFIQGDKALPWHFLYFGVVFLVSLLTNGLLLSSTIILSGSIAVKYLVIRYIIDDFFSRNQLSKKIKETTILLISISLLIVFSLPSIQLYNNGYYYVGQFSPNVWHNSTTIFLMPFALLLFWQSYKQILDSSTKRIYLISLLVVINIFSKPSFFFGFCIIYPLFLLFKYKLKKEFFFNIIPVFIGGILLILQYIWIYETDSNSSITIAPFSVWNILYPTKYFILTLITSFTFPIAYLYLTKNRFDILTNYTVSLVVFGLIIFVFLAETGDRFRDMNFAWQAIIASFLLFLISIIQVFKNIKQKRYNKNKIKILLFIYSLHIISGLLFFYKMISTKSFL